LVLAGIAPADTFATAAPNNSSGGIAFDLTASGSNNLVFESLAVPLSVERAGPVV
jgi:hypothetical protein